MKILIKPLDEQTLIQATLLRDEVFPNLPVHEKETLLYSLYDKKELRLGIKFLEYWVALKDDNVIGLVGLYTEIFDPVDVIWLGWYCVDPDVRDKGIGNQLLHYAIDIAQQKGYKKLKLYTTMADEYSAARRLYEKIGFRDSTRSKRANTRYYTLAIGA